MEEMIKQLFEEKYIGSYDTLKEIAKDDSQGVDNINYPIDKDNIKMLNWDSKLKLDLSLCQDLCGVDTVDIQNKRICLIEFKNGTVKPQELRLKGAETVLTLFRLLKNESMIENFSEVFNLKMRYYVVLNKDVGKNTKYLEISSQNSKNRDRLRKKKIISAVSDAYKDVYFEKIEILSFEQFEERYLNKYYRK